MKTQEIPRDEWPAFLDSFTSRYKEWLTDLEVFGSLRFGLELGRIRNSLNHIVLWG